MLNLLLPFFHFIFAFAFYFLFFIFVWIVGVFSGPTPNGSFCKAHLYSFPVYVGLNLFCIFFLDIPLLTSDLIVGLVTYFMLHYAIVVNFFSLASRSVSSTLLVELSQLPKTPTTTQLMQAYAGGKGFSFVKANRLENMLQYGLAIRQSGVFMPTSFGKRFYRLLEQVLGAWKLRQIGEN